MLGMAMYEMTRPPASVAEGRMRGVLDDLRLVGATGVAAAVADRITSGLEAERPGLLGLRVISLLITYFEKKIIFVRHDYNAK